MPFRVVVAGVTECSQALGALHSRYPVVPVRFRDYLSTPKPNGYQSLHTGLIGPERQRIEVQIRTHEMHDIAEFGVAAHWKYKQGDYKVDGRQYRWLRELLDILDHASNPEEFLEHTKLEMFQDQVFCFTPKGVLIALPSGATPVDFAYAVHSEVGDTCVGAKVNGRILPLRSKLQNGDQGATETRLTRWNKKKLAKPDPIGRCPSDRRANLYQPTAIVQWAEKAENYLTVPQDKLVYRIMTLAVPPIAE